MAKLTRTQVEQFYLRPAAERSRALRDDFDSTGSGEPAATVPLDDKEAFIAGMSAQFPGQPRAKWEADWDRMNQRK